MEQCAECGFVYDPADVPRTSRRTREFAAEISGILSRGGDGADLLSRRSPEVWSPLEYGCHMRDVLLVQRERVLSALRVPRFECVPMGRDERVEHDGYAEQEPADVARQLTDAAAMFGRVLDRLDRLDAGAWDREVLYPYPDPTPRTLGWVALHTAHEAQHHLGDIRRQL